MDRIRAVRLQGIGALVFFARSARLRSAHGARCACLLDATAAVQPFRPSYLHMRQEDAVNAAPPVTAWLLQRWYSRAMARNH